MLNVHAPIYKPAIGKKGLNPYALPYVPSKAQESKTNDENQGRKANAIKTTKCSR
jgi:hypothetical protein